MKMHELSFEGAQPPIDSYAPGGFRVAGLFREGAMLLSPSGLAPWAAREAAALTEAEAAPILALGAAADVILVGLGADLVSPPPTFYRALTAEGGAGGPFGVEFMATPAACRTYNVLLSEDRRVAAALLTV